jgi:hypothetical protein
MDLFIVGLVIGEMNSAILLIILVISKILLAEGSVNLDVVEYDHP